jgi:chlorobactene glucosyltransferase
VRAATGLAAKMSMPLVSLNVLLAACVAVLLWRDARALRRLPSLAAQPRPQSGRVSIIIPARNEARAIGACLDGALGQHSIDTHVIVVDDASTDDTPSILADYQARWPGRITVLQGRPLPPGWVGKCNACLWGARHAAGDWLLFLDADTQAGPVLAAALAAHAGERRLDALSILPSHTLGTLGEKIILPVFFQFIFAAFPVRRLLDPEMPPESALANGQCLFVRSAAYWSIGGHEAVKDKVLEDVEFAQALRRAGFRLGLAVGLPHLRVRMYHAFGEIVEGLGKHAMAGRRRAGWRALWAIARTLLIAVAPTLLLPAGLLAAALVPGAAGIAAAVAGASAFAAGLAFWIWRYGSAYRQAPGWALLAPLGMLLYLAIAGCGMLRALTRRGVMWKGRAYAE